MEAIRTQGLTKFFGDVLALDGLSLSVQEGTVFGFLGPNGAGKTTTIRILTGLARATSGRAWVAGMRVDGDRNQVARRIGYLPEDVAFYGWMTPREFLAYVGRLFGLTGAEAELRAWELLELVGLDQVAGRRIAGFSRGMRQRLGVAQALVNRPEVLFLDEPASALDPAGRKEVLQMIGRLRGACTVFMSTHILADVERVCDSVAIIAEGRMVAEAPQDELISRYAAPVFEVEGDRGTEGEIEEWSRRIGGLDWVSGVSVEGTTARITVREVEKAKRLLVAAAAESGVVLRRYEMVRPSLEDVFLRLVGDEGGEE
jgi:ABC-2 type transport system ATP-binding protein